MTYIGLDTETQDGRAVLITTPREYARVRSWADCVRFLFAQDTDDFILFNMNYDARAIAAYLPKRALRELDLQGHTKYREYTIMWRGKKSFSITRAGGLNGRTQRTIHFWDLYPWFESSLDNAAHSYLSARKLGIPKSWYTSMEACLSDTRAKRVVRYGCRDAELTERLWRIVERQCTALGVDPRRAASPASVAKRAFAPVFKKLESCTRTNGVFQHAYYGGRTEVFQRGRIGRVYAYDLHSAYPAVASTLVDPTGCEIVRVGRNRSPGRRDAAYGCYRIAVHVPPGDPIPPLAYRAPDRLVYPCGVFITWTDLHMLRLLQKWRYEHRVLYGLEYVVRDRRKLFPDISHWYKVRETNPALKLGAKKVLNSLYGKCAEQVRIRGARGGAYIRPGMRYHQGRWYANLRVPARHTSFAVAGAISGGVRARVWEAMRTCPSAIVAVHTDGILSTVPLRLDFGDDMGDWGYEGKHDCAWIIGTGLGIFKDGPVWSEKMRGVQLKHTGQSIRSVLKSKKPVCPVRVRHARTLHEVRRRSYSDLNEMVEIERNLNCNMDRKRIWPRDWQSFREFARNRQRSESILIVEKRALDALSE